MAVTKSRFTLVDHFVLDLRDYEYFNQHHTTSPTSGKRNTGTIPTVPPTTFRENNELYYDGAEGPDKIGTYNVYNWKEPGFY